MNIYDVIKKPLITEKAMAAREATPLYAFAVDLRSGKCEIRAAVEKIFKVHVKKINTAVMRGKIKRVGRSVGKRSNWKKAWVELATGEKIEFFEGV